MEEYSDFVLFTYASKWFVTRLTGGRCDEKREKKKEKKKGIKKSHHAALTAQQAFVQCVFVPELQIVCTSIAGNAGLFRFHPISLKWFQVVKTNTLLDKQSGILVTFYTTPTSQQKKNRSQNNHFSETDKLDSSGDNKN